MNPLEILFHFNLTLRSSRSSDYVRGVTSSDTELKLGAGIL